MREVANLDAIDRRIIDGLQGDFPICERPYQVAAERLGISEEELLQRLDRLLEGHGHHPVNGLLIPFQGLPFLRLQIHVRHGRRRHILGHGGERRQECRNHHPPEQT